jgi:multidrug resistance efflux pump
MKRSITKRPVPTRHDLPLRERRRRWQVPAPVRRSCLLLPMTLALVACSGATDAPATGASATAGAPTSTYAAVARGRVDIEGGLLNLSMAQEGTVAAVAVHEGDHVRRGQLLAELDDEPATLAVDAAMTGREQAQAQVALLGIRQAAAKQRAQRLVAAAAAGAGDGQSADDAREAVAQLDAERQSAQAAVAMAEQKLAAARYVLKQQKLLAPVDADVVRVSAQVGARVSPSSGVLFTLLPQKPRIVRAELNESFVAVVHPGMRADVAINGDNDHAHWGAHVLRVGEAYDQATLETDPQVRANARTVECVLTFDQPQDLRIGQRVIVRFAPTPAVPAVAPKG